MGGEGTFLAVKAVRGGVGGQPDEEQGGPQLGMSQEQSREGGGKASPWGAQWLTREGGCKCTERC